MTDENRKITVTRDGPYVVEGDVPLRREVIVIDERGQSLDWKTTETFATEGRYELCRCGRSKQKPFCDGSHATTGFDGTETADRGTYLSRAQVVEGPVLSLADDESLCAFARFCDPNGRVWNQAGHTDEPAVARTFVTQTNNCSAGRLVPYRNADGIPLEAKREPAIGITEDTARGCAGPLWVQGCIPVVSEDGTLHEVRNRVTLCRCGASSNKPFCDGTHAAINFHE